MKPTRPRVTVCIPHWQVLRYARLCLRSLRRHSAGLDLEVIVVDNGSRDESLDYLRSLDWIRLIERPEETPANWPLNVFTAWDRGLHEATGEFFVTMHSDVFIHRDGWLRPLLAAFEGGPRIAATGAWKLELEHPLYSLQKRFVGFATDAFKSLFRGTRPIRLNERQYPRDYCAVYRTRTLIDERLQFRPLPGHSGGGLSIARQLWDAGYETALIPVPEMARYVYHVAHGTAAVAPEKPLNHRRAQKKVERKVRDLFDADWIRNLERDESLDRARAA
ncbi:MAG: glycosyltransferase [Planctomycetes bacterium]|nr:glycosyltransferase [Planctomycetota bacterium]